MNQLDIISVFGEDALTNHFMMIIPAFPKVLQIANLNMRVLTCEIPQQQIGTYTITKRGRTMTRPSGVSEQGNEFTWGFRVDKYFQTYQAISQWMQFIQNPSTMAGASDSGPLGVGGLSEYRVPVVVNGLDTNNIITNVWTLTGCYPTSVDAVSFDEESGDPIVVSVTMQYQTMYYPGMII
jgi:hypothetical protein